MTYEAYLHLDGHILSYNHELLCTRVDTALVTTSGKTLFPMSALFGLVEIEASLLEEEKENKFKQESPREDVLYHHKGFSGKGKFKWAYLICITDNEDQDRVNGQMNYTNKATASKVCNDNGALVAPSTPT